MNLARTARIRTSLVPVFLTLVFLALASALLWAENAEAAWQTTKIADASILELDVGNGRVVWSARQPGDLSQDIYLYDSATGQTRNITQGNAYQNDRRPVIEGDWLAWQRNWDKDAEIYSYRISSQGPAVRVTTDNYADELPYLDEGRIVWSKTAPDSSSDLYVYYCGPGTTRQVTNDFDSYVSPRMSGPWIASMGQWGGEWDTEVKVNYLGQPPFAGLVTNNSVDDSYPDISGDWITWYESTGSGFEVYLYNVQTRERRNLTPNQQSHYATTIDGNYVAWMGGTGEQTAGWDNEIFLYDIAAKTTTRLTNNAVDDQFPVLEGNDLVWRAYDTVYHRDLSTGVTTKVAEVSPYVAWLDVEGGLVAFADPSSVYVAEWATAQPPTPQPPGGTWPPVLPPGVTQNFSDVDSSHPYYQAITGLRGIGAVSGYGDNTFRPDNNLWRAQFAKMIVEAYALKDSKGQSVNESMVAPFTDLGPDDPTSLYPHDYIAVIADTGVTVGKTATTFDPWGKVTRAQVVTMVVRAVQAVQPSLISTPPAGYQSTLGSFDPTHGQTMAIAQYNGWLAGLVGFGAGWDPWQPATRGECAQIIWNVIP